MRGQKICVTCPERILCHFEQVDSGVFRAICCAGKGGWKLQLRLWRNRFRRLFIEQTSKQWGYWFLRHRRAERQRCVRRTGRKRIAADRKRHGELREFLCRQLRKEREQHRRSRKVMPSRNRNLLAFCLRCRRRVCSLIGWKWKRSWRNGRNAFLLRGRKQNQVRRQGRTDCSNQRETPVTGMHCACG